MGCVCVWGGGNGEGEMVWSDVGLIYTWGTMSSYQTDVKDLPNHQAIGAIGAQSCCAFVVL